MKVCFDNLIYYNDEGPIVTTVEINLLCYMHQNTSPLYFQFIHAALVTFWDGPIL